MRHLERANLRYPNLWRGCVGAWAPLLGPSGTTLRDQSPNGNHGTLTSMDPATDWVVRDGKHALDFDGTNDTVTLGDPPSLRITGSMTLSCWISVSKTVAEQSVISKTGLSGNRAAQLAITGNDFVASSKISFGVATNSTTLITQTSVGSIYPASYTPMHICGVYNAENQTIATYVDGIDKTTTPVASVPSSQYTANSLAWTLGGRPSSLGSHTLGYVDDFRMYNRALSPSEIQLLATRRGIAYETNQRRSYKSAAAPPPAGIYLPIHRRKYNSLIGR